MVDVRSRKCRNEGCVKIPAFGVAGTKMAEYCASHAPVGIANVKNRKCRTEDCGKQPSFGVAGTEIEEYCTQHVLDGMVEACSRKSRTGGCGKIPSLGVANTRMAEYCAQQTRLNCGVEGYKEREIGPHLSGKKTIGNVLPTGARPTTVHPPRTKTSLPSDGSRGSRKRVRQPDMTSTASKRAILRESAGVARTIPDIDGQKSLAKRNSSVKVEV